MSTLIKLIFGILLIVVAVALGPMLIIWSLNTLFPIVNIPYTWETWAAAFFLSAPFSSVAFKGK
jgi:hypothetical protein